MQKADADRERRSNSASEGDASPDTKTTKDTTRVPLPSKGGHNPPVPQKKLPPVKAAVRGCNYRESVSRDTSCPVSKSMQQTALSEKASCPEAPCLQAPSTSP